MGIQAHIAADDTHIDGPGLTAFMASAQSLGLKLLLTEMDVNDRALPPANDGRDREVAARYASFLKTTLGNPDLIAVLGLHY